MATALERARQRIAARNIPTPQLSTADSSAPGGSSSVSSSSAIISSLLHRSGQRAAIPAFRVGQLDAEILDHELLELLRSQVADGLKLWNAQFVEDWVDEIRLALQAVLFKFSIWDQSSTYGAAMQGLKLSDGRHRQSYTAPTRWQKAAYGIVTLGGAYAWRKWEDWIAQKENGEEPPSAGVQRMARIFHAATTVHSVAAVLSFMAFLADGRYRTILDRMLGLRLIAPTDRFTRLVSMEYLNRQLVWHALTEFLLFILPLVGVARWRRWLRLAWYRVQRLARGQGADSEEKTLGELPFLPKQTCAICYRQQHPTVTSMQDALASETNAGGVKGSVETDITNPYSAIPCGCVYDYACLVGAIQQQEGLGWACLRCGALSKQCEPWTGDAHQQRRNPLTSADKMPDESQGGG